MVPETDAEADDRRWDTASDGPPPAHDRVADPEILSVDEALKRVRNSSAPKQFGWRTLDDLELGLNPGDLAVVAGRTGHGKSTVLMNILLHWVETYPDEEYVFFSHEVPQEAAVVKLISLLSRKYGEIGWSYREARRGIRGNPLHSGLDLDTDELARAIWLLKEWEDRLIIIYEPDFTVAQIGDCVGDLVHRGHRIGGLFVDYIQLVGPPEGIFENREHEVSAIAKDLKRIGVMAECPVVAAAQIGREAAEISGWIPEGSLEDERVLNAIAKRRPQLHHLREGGGDQEADLVLGLLNYQADYLSALEDADLDPKSRLQSGLSAPFDLTIIKNRFGQLALASLILESRTGYLRDPGVFGR